MCSYSFAALYSSNPGRNPHLRINNASISLQQTGYKIKIKRWLYVNLDLGPKLWLGLLRYIVLVRLDVPAVVGSAWFCRPPRLDYCNSFYHRSGKHFQSTTNSEQIQTKTIRASLHWPLQNHQTLQTEKKERLVGSGKLNLQNPTVCVGSTVHFTLCSKFFLWLID